MDYEEFYKQMHEYFITSIKTKNKALKDKIINIFEIWYKKEKEEKIKQAIKNKNGEALMAIAEEIKKLADSDDITKLKNTYIDTNFNKMLDLSREIYEKVQMQIEQGVLLDENKIKYYKDRISSLEKSISPLFKEEFLQEKSECDLDLDFLANKGQVDIFSKRVFRILKVEK